MKTKEHHQTVLYYIFYLFYNFDHLETILLPSRMRANVFFGSIKLRLTIESGPPGGYLAVRIG